MRELWDSIVRTFIPIIVGAVLGWFASAGIVVDAAFEPSLIAVLTAAGAAVWYLAARLLEKYVSPKFGWLLGSPKQPVYVSDPEKTAVVSTEIFKTPDT